jgi:hypothetical protein
MAISPHRGRQLFWSEHESAAERHATQIMQLDGATDDERRGALHALAALSSSDEMPPAGLCQVVRSMPGCVERLCALLDDDAPAVVAAALYPSAADPTHLFGLPFASSRRAAPPTHPPRHARWRARRVLLGNFGAEATADDMGRMRSAGGTQRIYTLVLTADEASDTLLVAAGACMNLCRSFDEAMLACAAPDALPKPALPSPPPPVSARTSPTHIPPAVSQPTSPALASAPLSLSRSALLQHLRPRHQPRSRTRPAARQLPSCPCCLIWQL